MNQTTLIDIEPVVLPEPEPVRIKGRINISLDFTANLTELVKKYPDEYKAAVDTADGKGYYQSHEAGAIFLHNFLEEQLDYSLGGYPEVQEGWGDIQEIDFKWTKELHEQLESTPKRRCLVCDKGGDLLYCSIECHKEDRPELYE